MSWKAKLDEKHNQYKAIHDQKEEKYQFKKRARKDKLQRRARFDHKPYIVILRLFAWLVIIMLLFMIFRNTWNTYQDYMKTDEWEKSGGPVLASIPPEIMYDDQGDQDKQLEYIDHASKIWNDDVQDFRKDVTSERIETLSTIYEEIGNKEHLEDLHNTITGLWNVQLNYNNLLTKDDDIAQYYKEDADTVQHTIAQTTALTDINTFIESNQETIMAHIIEPGEQRFANRMHTNMMNLSHDVTVMDNALAYIDPNFKLSADKVTVPAYVLPGDVSDLSSYSNNLNYNWQAYSDIDQLIGKSENILNDYQTKYDAYSEYEADINERDTFLAFNSSYNNAKNDLLAQIVKYKNFEGDKVDEIESWAKDNDITLDINKVESDESVDTILDQSPSTSTYKRILKGSTVEIDVAIKKKEKKQPVTRSSSDKDDKDDKDDDDKETRSRSESSTESRSTSRSNTESRSTSSTESTSDEDKDDTSADDEEDDTNTDEDEETSNDDDEETSNDDEDEE